jgi:hypothetical protein
MDRSQSKLHRHHQARSGDDLCNLCRALTALVVAIWALSAMLLIKVFCL